MRVCEKALLDLGEIRMEYGGFNTNVSYRRRLCGSSNQGDTCEALIKAVEELKTPLKPLLKAPFGRFRH